MKRITGRSWAFVIYPESMPENYEEIIIETGLPFAMSPLHDKDLDPTGEPKKPHYHVIVYYENATTLNNVKTNVCEKLNGTIPIKLESMRGMYRYHIHLDNPEKYQYDDRDRKFYNGFDIDMASKLTQTEIDKMINDILEFIEDNNIIEYRDLVFCLNGLSQMKTIACKNTVLFNTYIKSKRHKQAQHEKDKEAKRKEMND